MRARTLYRSKAVKFLIFFKNPPFAILFKLNRQTVFYIVNACPSISRKFINQRVCIRVPRCCDCIKCFYHFIRDFNFFLNYCCVNKFTFHFFFTTHSQNKNFLEFYQWEHHCHHNAIFQSLCKSGSTRKTCKDFLLCSFSFSFCLS